MSTTTRSAPGVGGLRAAKVLLRQGPSAQKQQAAPQVPQVPLGHAAVEPDNSARLSQRRHLQSFFASRVALEACGSRETRAGAGFDGYVEGGQAKDKLKTSYFSLTRSSDCYVVPIAYV